MFIECLGRFNGRFSDSDKPLPTFVETHSITAIRVYEQSGIYSVILDAFDGEDVQCYVVESGFSSEKSARECIRDIIYAFDGSETVCVPKECNDDYINYSY